MLRNATRRLLAIAAAAALAWTLFLIATPAQAQAVNVARSASPTASYTSSWESIAAINDGIEPPGSNDTANPRWGTWPQTGQQWVQLTWPSAATVSSSDMYFFDDSFNSGPGGVQVPASWRIEYLSNGTWTAVTGASGYGVAANAYNHTNFNAVTTTAVRAVLQSGAASVGVLEWKVWGTGSTTPSGNPIVRNIYTADPATLVVGNTMYLFSGRDQAAAGQQSFVMNE
jgi:hypothetical protein